jgi:hypothetical protein
MRSFIVFLLTASLPPVISAAPLPAAKSRDAKTDPKTAELLSRVPLRFEPNRGQVRAAEPVAWTARNPEAAYAFTADGALIRTKDRIVRLRMQGSNTGALYQASEALPSPTSYFTAAYRGNIPGYRRLRRSSVYPGIDVVYYGAGNHLEYDFEVAVGADPAQIRLAFEGPFQGSAARVTDAGDLQIGEGDNALVQRAPVIYQQAADGSRKPVEGGYRMAADGTVTIALGAYDRTTKLVIDPTIYYTQYFFGSAASPAVAVTHDAQGYVYVAGNTQATDFYVQGAFAILGNKGGQDAWIMKINPLAPDGNYVPFTTLFGGSNNEIVEGIAVDNNGVAYIAGVTQSTDMPTVNPYASALPGQQNTFIAAFDTVGATQTYGTYLGGALVDYDQGIALLNGNVYVTGYSTSTNYPTTGAAIETTPIGGTEIFVSELNPALSGAAQLIASTYLPGSADDVSRAIAVDSAGNVYIAGETGSPDTRVTANAVQGAYNQSGDGFVIKLNLQTMQVLYGTFLGGSSYDEIRGLTVDAKGRIGVTGFTESVDFPVTQSAFQTSLNGYQAAFLTVVDPAAKAGAGLVYSTYFGGNFAEAAYSAAVDKSGLFYISGYALSPNLPMGAKTAMNATSAGGGIDGFVAQFDITKGINGLLYSSYITGPGNQLAAAVDVDSNGIVYVVGAASADVFPSGQSLDPNSGVLDGFLLAFHP